MGDFIFGQNFRLTVDTPIKKIPGLGEPGQRKIDLVTSNKAEAGIVDAQSISTSSASQRMAVATVPDCAPC